MNRECKLYLSLKKQVEKQGNMLGKSDLQVEQMISDLFTGRTGKIKKDGIRVPGTVFSYKNVAD